MNIFVTDIDPVQSAKFLDDRRVVKMCLETAQMLCTATWSLNIGAEYRPTHPNHPCNIWVRRSKQNFLWLYHHGIALCKEYTARYGKVHKSQSVIENLLYVADYLPNTGMTPFANCAANKQHGIDYKSEPIVYVAYQKYLNDRWELTDKNPTYYGRSI